MVTAFTYELEKTFAITVEPSEEMFTKFKIDRMTRDEDFILRNIWRITSGRSTIWGTPLSGLAVAIVTWPRSVGNHLAGFCPFLFTRAWSPDFSAP